jgi:hypothetical protein
MPEHALLLVTRGPGGPALQPVECDPAIITLPRVSTTPLHDPAAAAVPEPSRSQRFEAGTPHDSWPAWGRQPHTADQVELPQISPRNTPSRGT